MSSAKAAPAILPPGRICGRGLRTGHGGSYPRNSSTCTLTVLRAPLRPTSASAPVFTDEVFVQAVRSEAGTKVGYSVGCTKYRQLSIPLRLKLHG